MPLPQESISVPLLTFPCGALAAHTVDNKLVLLSTGRATSHIRSKSDYMGMPLLQGARARKLRLGTSWGFMPSLPHGADVLIGYDALCGGPDSVLRLCKRCGMSWDMGLGSATSSWVRPLNKRLRDGRIAPLVELECGLNEYWLLDTSSPHSTQQLRGGVPRLLPGVRDVRVAGIKLRTHVTQRAPQVVSATGILGMDALQGLELRVDDGQHLSFRRCGCAQERRRRKTV